MVSARDALVTILAVVLSVLAFGYVFVTPSNILLVTMVPGILLPVAYVLDRRRRAGAVGLQRGEGRLLATGTASAAAWALVFFVLPAMEIVVVAAAISIFAIVLVVRSWQRFVRTP